VAPLVRGAVKIERTDLPGVLLIEPQVFADRRGDFCETFQHTRYREAGITVDFCQDNVTASVAGVVRGLHLQNPNPQAKLVTVLEGSIFDVCVDVRRASPTFGRWIGVHMSGAQKQQIFIPEGFAHGYATTSKSAIVSYKCSALYQPRAELTISWCDPEIGIVWPVAAPILSAKDAAAPRLREIDAARLPEFVGA
jgi:dTDP-4-dehydrorhamnose 3,5-epimerase